MKNYQSSSLRMSASLITPPIRSKFYTLILIFIFVLGVGNAWAGSYTITFATNSGDGTSGTAGSTAMSNYTSSSFVTGKVVTATSAYYKGVSGLKLGTSSGAGVIKFNLASSGQVYATKIVVSAKRYNTSKAATVNINSGTARDVSNSSNFNNYEFAINGSVTYIQINSSKYIWVQSVTVYYPELTASKTSITGLNYEEGSGPSAAQSFNITGTNLAGNITVTAQTDFEVCKTSNGTYSNSISFTPSEGAVGSSAVYVRLAAGKSAGSYGSASTYVTVASSNATTKNVSVQGTVTAAASCTSSISITKGTPEHGSFDMTGAGAVCIDDENASVTISNIQPAEGYRFKQITSSGGGTINNEAKTVSNISANTTINVEFEVIPPATVSFSTGIGNSAQADITETSAGAGITLPAAPSTIKCSSDGWVFAGWSETNVSSSTTTAPTLLAAGDTYHPTDDITLYAVYKQEAGSGLVTQNFTITFDNNSTDATSDISADDFKNYVTTNADKVSSFSSITKCYKGATGVKISSGKYNGSFTLNLSESLAIKQVDLNTKKKSTGTSASNGVSVGTTAFSTTSSYSDENFVDLVFTGTKTTSSAITIVSTCSTSEGTSADGRVSWLKSIKIYYEANVTTYNYLSAPTCCEPLDAIHDSFNATSKSQTSVTLGWANETTASDVDHYELRYKVKGAAGDPSVASNSITNNVHSYIVSNLECGTEYTFTLDAIGNAHCNAQEVIDVTTNKYTITASGVGGDLVLAPSATSVCDGDEITLTATSPDGSHEGNGTIKVIKTGVAPEVDVTTAVYNSGTGKLTMPAYDITISATYAEKSSPSVGVSVSEFNFGSPKKGASVTAETFNLTGSALEAGTLTLVAPSGYTVSPSSIVVAAGSLAATEITVTPNTATAGTFNGNISISGAGVASTNIVALSMTVQETYTVNWYVNGGASPVHSQTDVANTDYDEVPSDFSAFTDCVTDFHFVGWKEGAIEGGSTTSAPSLADVGTKITANKNYYAVFAEGTLGSISWTRVTAVNTLTAGGTFILGYEADPTNAKGTIVPMQNSGTLTTSAAGYIYSGDTDDASNNNTINMSTISSTSKYEITIAESEEVEGAINIKFGSNFLGNENTKNNAKLYTTDAATRAFKPTIGTNDAFKLDIEANTSGSAYRYLKFNNNSGSYRFAVYSTEPAGIVFYKKTISAPNFTKWYTTCPHVSRVNLSAANVSNGSISFEVSGSPVTNVRTDGGEDVEVDVVIASHDTGYGLSGVELSGVVGATYSNSIITIPANAEGTLVATATFAQANYTVTLNQSPAVGATLVGGTTEAHYGDPISLSTDIPANAFFVNWTSDDVTITNPTSATGASFTMPDGNVTVTANFNEIHNVAWAIENTPSTGSLSNVYVKGIVTSITEINTSYYNATYYISDLDENGAPVNSYLVFRAKREGNTNYTSTDQLKEGDEVTVFGSLKTYNSTKEFDQGCYIITNGRTAATFDVVVSGTADKTDYYANEIFAYAGLTAKAEYSTGYKKVVTDDATWKANNVASYTITATGTVNVTATWNETTSANYPVAVAVTTKVLESISLSEDALVGYKGIALPKPTTVTAHFDDQGVKSTSDVTAFAEYSDNYNSTSTSEQTITVSYQFGNTPAKTADYTVTLTSIRNTLNTAYSVEKGREIVDLDNIEGNDLDLDEEDNKVFVLGRVTAVSGNTYTIKDNTDDEEFIEIYDGTLGTGISSVEVGDLIKVEGNLFYYENNTHTVFKYQIKNGEILWKQPKVGITIADKTLEVGDEPWTIVATIDPVEAPVIYSIKEGSDACLTLSGDVITATAEGTATIIAHADAYNEYLANEKEFTVIVNPAAVHTNVVLYAAYDDGNGVKYYALDNAAGSTEINLFNGKVLVPDLATKNAIVWDRAERTDALGDYAIFYNAAVDKYLTTGSSNSMAVGASADWYWNADGYYEKNSGRTFIYRASAGCFKDYSTGNAGTSDYADYTVIYAGEVVVGEIVELRATSAGRYGTICWPKRIEAIEGGMFFNAVGKDDAKVYLEDAPTPYPAGKPYFFLSESESLKGVVSGDDAPAGTNGALVGTFSDMYQSDIDAAAAAAGSDIHIVAGNMLWTVNGQSDNKIPANRAYLLIGNVPNINNVPAPAPGRRRLSVGISQPEHTPTGLEDNVADMQGVHKFMQNGKLYIIRNGKMYDAQGKMVK